MADTTYKEYVAKCSREGATPIPEKEWAKKNKKDVFSVRGAAKAMQDRKKALNDAMAE